MSFFSASPIPRFFLSLIPDPDGVIRVYPPLEDLPVARHPDHIPGNKEPGQSRSFTASRNVMHARNDLLLLFH